MATKKRLTPRQGTTVGFPWDSVPDLMYRVRGADGAIELLSAAFATHTGWSVAEWIGRPFAELVYADDLPQANNRYAAILSGEMPARNELRIRTKAGGFVIGEFHSAPLLERGRVVGEQGIARDITHRRRAEEAREAREERFRTLFESTDEALFLMDGSVFLDINPKGLEMFGLHDRSDIIGRSPVDFSPPRQPDGRDSRDTALAYILAALQGCPQRFYWKHARKDGKTFDTEVSLNALTLYGRVHLQATVRDITARQAAEQAMRESEKRFRLLAAHVPAEVWTTDTDLRLTSISGSLVPPVERLDLRKAGTSLYELFATRDDRHPVIAAHRRALGGVSAQYERTAGAMVIEGRVEPLRDGTGAVVGCVGVALDITERQHARGAMRRLTDFVESSEDAIITTTLDGTIETWNPAAERLYGYPAREAVGRPITLIVPADSVAGFQRNMRLLEQGQPVGRYEAQRVRRDGSAIRVSVTMSAIRDGRGALVGFSGIIRDITERKRMEEVLEEREERFREITDNMREAFWIAKADLSEVLYASPAFEVITERKQESPQQDLQTFFGLIHPDDRAQVMDDLASVRGGVGVEGRVFRVVRPGGEIRWVLGRTVAVRNSGGEVYRLAGVVQDITERQRAQEALRASEETLRLLLEQLPIGVSLVDKDRRVTYANVALERILRLPRNEILQGRHEDWRYVRSDGTPMPPEELASVRASREGRHVRDVETGVITERGETIWTSVSAAPLPGSDGGVLIATVDITERRTTEETLRREQFLVNTLMESIPDSIYFKDAASRFIRVNRNLARLFGLSDPAQAVGKTDFDFFTRDHAQAALETEQQVIRTGHPVVDMEEMETWPDRPSTWVSSTKMPLRDATGAVIGTFGISRDITERKRAEEALRRSEADYRGLVDHAPLGVYRSTRDGRFLTVNAALVSMLGYDSAEELLHLDMARDVYAVPGDRDRVIREDRSQAEVEWKRRDGARILVQLSSRVIPGPAGEGECYEGMVRDVTEQRSLEDQFRQAQRLEAVGRLAGGVAHDFNNILTAITGYAELLLEGLDPADPKREDVQEIKAAAHRAAGLTRQLLAFSRKQVLQTRVLDLNAVVHTLEKMLRRLIGEDVKLEVALSAALGAVRADPGQLEQVILNLAVNSRDAMPSGGRLTIETANVDFDEAYAREHAGGSPGRYVMLAISDTGVGMDAETQSHIFEPFFTTKEQGTGTGLGLATVYGIVKQSGGHVWVYSEPGGGATFKIYLPRVDEPVEAQEAAPAGQPVSGGRETVLVAEDDPSVREIVAEVLTQRGYRVLRAPDGQTALAMAHAEAGEIHLLVTDIVMPGMTGRELAETLTAERAGVRVLYMSGYTDDAVVRHRVLAEGLPYLQKPFTPPTLAGKVRELLDRS